MLPLEGELSSECETEEVGGGHAAKGQSLASPAGGKLRRKAVMRARQTIVDTYKPHLPLRWPYCSHLLCACRRTSPSQGKDFWLR